jgi:hypothetical protein
MQALDFQGLFCFLPAQKNPRPCARLSSPIQGKTAMD